MSRSIVSTNASAWKGIPFADISRVALVIVSIGEQEIIRIGLGLISKVRFLRVAKKSSVISPICAATTISLSESFMV